MSAAPSGTMRRARQFLLVSLFSAATCAAQTIVLDSFNAGATTGSVFPGTSWVGQVTPNPTSITVGGTATDVNGYGATGLSLNATGLTFLTVTAQRAAGNSASTLAVQFEDQALNTHVVSVNATAFAVDAPTTVQIPLPAAPTTFSLSQIVSWSLGGGGLGTSAWQFTLDLLSLTNVIDPDATLAPLGSLTLAAPRTGAHGLSLHGPGTLTLGTANDFTGPVVVTQGTLQLGATNALPLGAPVHLAASTTLNLAGFPATLGALTGSGHIALGAASLTLAQSTTSTFTGAISGTGGLTKTGSGHLTLTGTHTFTGPTALTAGHLILDGSAASSAFTVSGGTLSGSATIGPLTLASGGVISPGNSPGTIVAGAATFGPGGSYRWEINHATGTAGTHYDLLTVTGALTITATSGSPFAITLTSLLANNTAGDVINFNPAQNYTYTLATASSGITGFTSSAFTLDATNFTNALNGGTWSLAQSGNNLTLTFTASAIPEPSTYAALLGVSALALAARRRRST